MQVVLSMLMLLLGHALVTQGEGEDTYCTFEVAVRSPTGLPVKGVTVVGLDESGLLFGEATTDEKGLARICDSPHGLAEISVGGKLCGAVSVRYLNHTWPRTRHVVVTYQRCVGNDYYFPGRCETILRLVDPQNTPLGGVSLRLDPGVVLVEGSRVVSDRYGRMFILISHGGRAAGTLSKPGYSAMRFSQDCTVGEDSILDRTVALTPLPMNR